MTDKLFDSFIKQKLEHYESKVPQGLWDKIMPEEEKKPKGFWWMSRTAILIAIAVTVGVGTTTYVATKSNDKANIAAKQNQNNSINQNTNTEKNTANTNQLNVEKSGAAAQDNTTKNTNDIAANNVEQENIEKGNVEKSTATTNASKIKTTNNLQSGKENTTIASANNRQNTTDINSKNTIQRSNSNSLAKFNNASKKSNSIQSLASLSKNKGFKIDNAINTSSESNADANYILPQKNIQDFKLVTSEDLYGKLSHTANKNIEFRLGNLFGRTEDCPTAKGSPRNDFYLEAYASPDYTFRKVISTTTGLDQYLTKKDSVEVLRGGFTIGARISKSITNNLLLKAGIQYSQVNERFSLKTENERRQTIVINSHTINRPGMSDTTISDTSYYVQIGYRVQTNMNYYRNLEIPILLSYEFGDLSGKWRYALNGGAIVNLTSWYEGRTLDTNYKIVSISTKSNNSFYKQEIGFSLYGGLSIIRKISDKVDVFAEPYFRLGMNKMESVDGFNQKFNAIGLQLGTRIKLDKTRRY